MWEKYGNGKDLPLVPWDVCTMRKDKKALGLIDVNSQGIILVTKVGSAMLGGFM